MVGVWGLWFEVQGFGAQGRVLGFYRVAKMHRMP